MHRVAVGQPFDPRRRTWPERAQYNFSRGGHELLLILKSPDRREIEAVRRGPASFGLVVDGPAILLLYRFCPGLPWSDAPYSWHLVPAPERDLPAPVVDGLPQERSLCQVILVDAGTGIVLALRAVTWSPEFTCAIHRAIVAQSQIAWDAPAFDATLERLFASATSEQLVERAAARTEGGA